MLLEHFQYLSWEPERGNAVINRTAWTPRDVVKTDWH